MPTLFNLRNEPNAGTAAETAAAGAPSAADTVDAAATADESFPEIKGRVESKLMSMWHNVKYGKDNQTTFVIGRSEQQLQFITEGM